MNSLQDNQNNDDNADNNDYGNEAEFDRNGSEF